MNKALKIIWFFIKRLFLGKKRTELEQRIKELSKEIKPIEENYDKYKKLAKQVAASDRYDQLDYYDRMSAKYRRKLTAKFAEFGKAVYNAYRYKN